MHDSSKPVVFSDADVKISLPFGPLSNNNVMLSV